MVKKKRNAIALFFLFSLHANLAFICFANLTPPNPAIQTVLVYGLQIINLLTLCLMLRVLGTNRTLAAFRPVLLLMLVGFAASLLGFNPAVSLQSYLRWFFCITAAVGVGISCDLRTIDKLVFWYVFSSILLSIAFALFLPAIGMQFYGGTSVWRGIFPQKNTLGWFAVLSFAVALGLGRTQALWIRGLMLLIAAITLVKSGNAGGLGVMVGIGAFYVSTIFLIHSSRTPPLEMILTQVLILGGCIVIGAMTMEYVANTLHRDMTFTGRTDIWTIYFEAQKEHWLLGQGPGAYSADSSITQSLGQNSAFKDQFIRTPHNNILGFFGDSGILGVAAYLGMMLYLTFVRPAVIRTPYSIGCAIFAVAILLGGLLETHEVFSSGMAVFFLFLVYGMSLQKSKNEASRKARSVPIASPPQPIT